MPKDVQAKVKSSQSLLFPLAFAPPPFHSSPASSLTANQGLRLSPKVIYSFNAEVHSGKSQTASIPPSSLDFCSPSYTPLIQNHSTEKFIPAYAVVEPGKGRIASIPPASPTFASLLSSALGSFSLANAYIAQGGTSIALTEKFIIVECRI
jgi:hypothetical protein